MVAGGLQLRNSGADQRQNVVVHPLLPVQAFSIHEHRFAYEGFSHPMNFLSQLPVHLLRRCHILEESRGHRSMLWREMESI